ncbi:MAG: hypothetical protein ACTSRG_08800 [Candidatus Helarchaeota archaeon]
MVQLMNPKDYNPSIKFLLIFFLSLLVLFFIPGLFNGNVFIGINVSEVPGGVNQAFSFSTGLIVELVVMGPVFAIIYFILMKYMLNKIDETNNNRNFIFILEITTVLFICIYIMGHITHLMFDHASRAYEFMYGIVSLHFLSVLILIFPDKWLQIIIYLLSPLFLFLYYSDEWLGHHLIHFSLFTFMVLAIFTEILLTEHNLMKWDELSISIFFGIGASFVNGYATYEGQCAFPLFIFSLILLVFQIVYWSVKKIELRRYPIFLAMIICNIIVIGLFIFWVINFGIKPYYPFIYQPSEL